MSNLTYEQIYEISLKEKLGDLVELPETFYPEVQSLIASKRCLLNNSELKEDDRMAIQDEVRNIKRILINLLDKRMTKIINEAIQFSKIPENDPLIVKPYLYGPEMDLFNNIVGSCRETKKRLMDNDVKE